MANNNMRF